jgi:hypothetical protein
MQLNQGKELRRSRLLPLARVLTLEVFVCIQESKIKGGTNSEVLKSTGQQKWAAAGRIEV